MRPCWNCSGSRMVLKDGEWATCPTCSPHMKDGIHKALYEMSRGPSGNRSEALRTAQEWMAALTAMGEKASEEENRAIQILYEAVRNAIIDIVT